MDPGEALTKTVSSVVPGLQIFAGRRPDYCHSLVACETSQTAPAFRASRCIFSKLVDPWQPPQKMFRAASFASAELAETDGARISGPAPTIC